MKPELPRGFYRALTFWTASLGTIGLLIGAPALVVLAGGVAALAAAAGIYLALVGERIHVGREAPAGACQDDFVPVRLRVANRGRLPVYLLEIGDGFEPALDSAIRRLVPALLPPGFQYTVTYEGHCFRHRGAYHLGPLELQVRDPLGFFGRRRSVADFVAFDVYPRIVPMQEVTLPGGRPGVSIEVHSTPRPGHSLQYLGPRDYRPGDERRAIHWTATARAGRLIVREFEFDRPPMTMLVLDLDERHFEGLGQRSTLEFQVSVAASLALEVTRQRGSFEVVADGLALPAAAGPLQMEAFLHALVTLRAGSTRSIARVLGDAAERVRRDALVVPFVAGLEVEPERLEEAVRGCAAAGAWVHVVVLDDETFLKRQERRSVPGLRRLDPDQMVRRLTDAGARVCVLGGEDEAPVRIRELFEAAVP
jgi:uncharacterized protein (DUF58 family)